MVMDDVIGVAMVMDDVRGSSLAPEEPIVRSLAQKCYFYTIFRDKMCQKEYYPKWDPVTQFYALPFLHFRERLLNQIVLIN